MLALIEPSAALSPFVDGYVHVRDLAGDHLRRPIRTAPRPGGVLTVNLGQPNLTATGAPTPRMSLLGIQTSARGWRSSANACFVMALLTPPGLTRFAPGLAAADTLLDLCSIIGERAARRLVDSHPNRLVASLDAWLLQRLVGQPETREMRAVCEAWTVLSHATRVDAAAKELGVSRRHLSRVVSHHLGIGPKTLLDLHRLDRSVRALQRGDRAGIDGFADQAHQIREWRRRLGTTPGRYAREGRSELAAATFAKRPVFYL